MEHQKLELSVIVRMPAMRGAMVLAAEQGDPWPILDVMGSTNVLLLNQTYPDWLEHLCEAYDEVFGTTRIS